MYDFHSTHVQTISGFRTITSSVICANLPDCLINGHASSYDFFCCCAFCPCNAVESSRIGLVRFCDEPQTTPKTTAILVTKTLFLTRYTLFWTRYPINIFKFYTVKPLSSKFGKNGKFWSKSKFSEKSNSGNNCTNTLFSEVIGVLKLKLKMSIKNVFGGKKVFDK